MISVTIPNELKLFKSEQNSLKLVLNIANLCSFGGFYVNTIIYL